MKNDPASTMSQVINAMMLHHLSGMHVGFPCRIVKFDEGTCMANVQPLIRATSDDPAIIQNVPALVQRYKINGTESVCMPFLKAGDTVFVVCADTEIKNVLTGQIAKTDTVRSHDLNDAVIVGVFSCSL